MLQKIKDFRREFSVGMRYIRVLDVLKILSRNSSLNIRFRACLIVEKASCCNTQEVHGTNLSLKSNTEARN